MTRHIIFSFISLLLFAAEVSGFLHLNVRSRRNALSLAKQVQCATTTSKKTPSLSSLYERMMTYGCYCGLGGKGIPVDGIDKCCKAHDDCYQKAVNDNKCWSWQPYVTLYSYSAAQCKTNKVKMKCKTKSGCAGAICKCDQGLALCIKPLWHTYNNNYKEYQDSTFCTSTAKEIENANKANKKEKKVKHVKMTKKKVTENNVKHVIDAQSKQVKNLMKTEKVKDAAKKLKDANSTAETRGAKVSGNVTATKEPNGVNKTT